MVLLEPWTDVVLDLIFFTHDNIQVGLMGGEGCIPSGALKYCDLRCGSRTCSHLQVELSSGRRSRV